MYRDTDNRYDSLLELISLEKANLASLILQQENEGKRPSGIRLDLAPDIEACKMMISMWTARVRRESRA